MAPRQLARSLLAAALLAVAAPILAPSAFAQYKPPHFNDPHPPANQPAYQLPQTAFPRPGLPGYPGAPHFNDPHYRKTEPRTEWPRTTLPSFSPNPTRESLRRPYSTTPPAVIERRGANRSGSSRRPRTAERTISLEQCFRNWDPGTRMTRSSWNSTCRRIAVNGRVGLW